MRKTNEMTVLDWLLVYGEWLEDQGLMVGTEDSDDERTYEELARDFLLSRAGLRAGS